MKVCGIEGMRGVANSRQQLQQQEAEGFDKNEEGWSL